MKQVNNYRRTAQYLQKIYNLVNQDFFNGELPEVTVTLQESMKAYGHVTTSEVWYTSNGEGMKELNISANYINRPIENVVVTMIHEASHIYCSIKNLKDCSGAYHNRTFKRIAEEMGKIAISRHDKYGWTISEPTETTLDFCIKYDLQDIQINRDGVTSFGRFTGGTTGGTTNGTDDAPKPPKKKSSTRKYQCPVCGQSIRATKDVNIICGDCMVKMVKVD